MSEGSGKFPTTIIHQEDILTKLEQHLEVHTNFFFFLLRTFFLRELKNDDSLCSSSFSSPWLIHPPLCWSASMIFPTCFVFFFITNRGTLPSFVTSELTHHRAIRRLTARATWLGGAGLVTRLVPLKATSCYCLSKFFQPYQSDANSTRGL